MEKQLETVEKSTLFFYVKIIKTLLKGTFLPVLFSQCVFLLFSHLWVQILSAYCCITKAGLILCCAVFVIKTLALYWCVVLLFFFMNFCMQLRAFLCSLSWSTFTGYSQGDCSTIGIPVRIPVHPLLISQGTNVITLRYEKGWCTLSGERMKPEQDLMLLLWNTFLLQTISEPLILFILWWWNYFYLLIPYTLSLYFPCGQVWNQLPTHPQPS